MPVQSEFHADGIRIALASIFFSIGMYFFAKINNYTKPPHERKPDNGRNRVQVLFLPFPRCRYRFLPVNFKRTITK